MAAPISAWAWAWALSGVASMHAGKPFRFNEWSIAEPFLSRTGNYSVRTPQPLCEPEWAVCIIDKHNVHPLFHRHFPHSAQNLLPCWSFFTQFPRLRPVVLLRDGVHLSDGQWVQDLLALMGATVASTRSWDRTRCAVRGRLVDRPAPGGTGHEVRWLARESDAHLLRARLHQRHADALSRFRRPGDHSLHVGLLTRSGSSRSLVNEDAIAARVRRELPRATHSIALFDSWPFAQQAAWVAAQDVIISPHGAQDVNFAFARPCAAIAEIFPRYYYVPSFYLTLAQEVGAVAFVGYPGSFPLRDKRHMDLEGSYTFRRKARNVRLNVTADEVAAVLPEMMRARQRCLNERAADRPAAR